MLRKWMVFALSAAVLVSIAGVGFVTADDESPLEKVMEKVQKENVAIKKWTRTAVAYKKSHKDVAKSSKELVKLGKEAKPLKDALGKAKNEPNPQKKWNELMDGLIGTSEKLSEVADKSTPDFDEAKKAFSAVTKACAECHSVFRVDDTNF
jgi:cytochrome c556